MSKDASCFATYKTGKIRQTNIKNIKLIIFTMTLLISKILMQGFKKFTKNHTETSVFTTLDILQLGKLMIMRVFIV